ncbi:MAG: type II toxin-antitoxin system RelE/ParE family toxin [Saccharofermentanales bacterium]|jgi:phage-related protein
MYEIVFYEDRSGNIPVLEHMKSLQNKNDKDSRVKLNKIRDYIQILKLHGTRAGEPYMKHLDGDIWELRPIRERILFAALGDGQFVLLHCFTKKDQKTPRREIEKARASLLDLKERNQTDE